MKNFIFTMTAATIMLCTLSCDKSSIAPDRMEGATGKIMLSVKGNTTRATGAGHGITEKDNMINTLDIFIFRNDPDKSDYGTLESHKRLTGPELERLDNIELKSTVGKRKIFVAANSHRADWSGVTTLEKFMECTVSLSGENISDFSMTGSNDITVTSETAATVNVSRLISRIHIGSIKADFGTAPYTELSNIKAYLVNVKGAKRIYDCSDNTGAEYINRGKYIPQESSEMSMPGMLYDDGFPSISAEAPYTADHYFYCFPNSNEEDNAETPFTRLVIQADIDGSTYYYPVNLENITRNTSYSYNITITRPGSLSPDEPVVDGSMRISIQVENWKVIPSAGIIF